MKNFVLMLTVGLLGRCSLAADKVLISVYFESLCPDSKAFIKNQLYPTFQELSDVAAVDLVPYGKATTIPSSNGTLNFTCQHGENECYGNKVETCAVALYPEESLQFVYCAEISETTASNETLRGCANETGIPWDDLQDCLDTGIGDKLLAAMGRRTHVANLTFVPTITFNNNNDNIVNQTFQDAVLADLQGFLCNLLGNEPEPCQ